MNVHGLFLYKRHLSTHIKFRGNRIFRLKNFRGNRIFRPKNFGENRIFFIYLSHFQIFVSSAPKYRKEIWNEEYLNAKIYDKFSILTPPISSF